MRTRKQNQHWNTGAKENRLSNPMENEMRRTQTSYIQAISPGHHLVSSDPPAFNYRGKERCKSFKHAVCRITSMLYPILLRRMIVLLNRSEKSLLLTSARWHCISKFIWKPLPPPCDQLRKFSLRPLNFNRTFF